LKRQKAEKVNVFKGFRVFGKPATENRLHAPKARALPTAPHPEILSFKMLQMTGFDSRLRARSRSGKNDT
jgi:hypothetical protein